MCNSINKYESNSTVETKKRIICKSFDFVKSSKPQTTDIL